MDPVTLSVGAVVAAVVAKATDKSVGAVVDAAADSVSKLVSWLRSRLTGAAGTALAKVEEVPDSPSRQVELARLVDEQVAADREFAASLKELVEQVRKSGADVTAVNQSAWGNQNVQVANASDVQVTYGASPGPAGSASRPSTS